MVDPDGACPGRQRTAAVFLPELLQLRACFAQCVIPADPLSVQQKGPGVPISRKWAYRLAEGEEKRREGGAGLVTACPPGE